jgi:hypothetical protein
MKLSSRVLPVFSKNGALYRISYIKNIYLIETGIFGLKQYFLPLSEQLIFDRPKSFL